MICEMYRIVMSGITSFHILYMYIHIFLKKFTLKPFTKCAEIFRPYLFVWWKNTCMINLFFFVFFCLLSYFAPGKSISHKMANYFFKQ